jgi:flagellum-specific ATP synthase
MVDVTPEEQTLKSNMMRDVLATYAEAEDLINIGAYVKGSNPKIDYAQSKIDEVNSFLKQRIQEKSDFGPDVNRLQEMFADTREPRVASAATDQGAPSQ